MLERRHDGARPDLLDLMTDPFPTTDIAAAPPPAAPAGFVEKAPLERYVPPDKPSLIGLSRAAPRSRVCLYPGGRPRHALPVEPGRLHAQLLVLPYRHAASRAQPHARRDRRPGHRRARPARRLAKQVGLAGLARCKSERGRA